MDKNLITVTSPLLPSLDDFTAELKKIWDSKWITNNGDYHKKLEAALAEYLKVPYVSLFTNGTLPLLTALQALRVTGEVITTPYSFVATTHSIWWNGCKPVFVDIDPATGNLDPNKIEAAITPKTTAIMPVHVYGKPCDTKTIQEIADLILEPRLFRDARGYFFESFSEREFEEKVAPILGHSVHFCQDNESMSSYGVMRGLHFQRPPYTQSKLVRCVKGRVLDVAVDIRKGSPTYGKHVAVELTEDNHVQFFIPKGFAHGFAVLSETAVFQYKCDNFYHPEADGGISILDDTLGIDWKIPTEHANLSEKDTKHAMLKDFDSPFDINVDLYK